MNHRIEVDVPRQTVYNQWTQFESFPEFMTGIERIEQVSDTKTHWVTKIMGVTREFDAEITEQHPDEWISWKTEGGLNHTGEVIFSDASSVGTLVAVQLDYEPQDIVEKAGDELGLVALRLERDLRKFKKFIESKDQDGEQDGWRGEIGEPLTEEEKADATQQVAPVEHDPDEEPHEAKESNGAESAHQEKAPEEG